jgi:hypothetical protein
MDLNTTLRRSYDTESIILRTLFALDPDTNMPISTNYVVTTDGVGGLVWLSPFTNLSTAGVGIGYLPSTIDGFRTNISSMSSLLSSVVIGLSSLSTSLGLAYISSGIYVPQLNSTIEGLGSARYISSSQLNSTIQGLASASYVSTSQLTSTTSWFLDPSRYVSTGALISTTSGITTLPSVLSSLTGLGSIGYISTSGLVSSIQGLGSSGYVSTLSLLSSVQGLSSMVYSTFYSTLVPQFITPFQLTSTATGLGSLSYVSTSQLISTTGWLTDYSRYISTGNLLSTSAAISTSLKTTFYIDNAGSLNIFGGTTIVSSAASVVFLSTFTLSSITYQGYNGTVTPVRYPDATQGTNMLFSTAKIPFANFSSLILNNSRVNLQISPTFLFPRLNTGATGYLLINMSTMLAYGTGYLSPLASSWVYAGTQASGFGNLYQQPIQLQIPGSLLTNKYSADYYLVHNLPNSVTSNLTDGFVNGNIEVRYGSTNSVFLSIQNLP